MSATRLARARALPSLVPVVAQNMGKSAAKPAQAPPPVPDAVAAADVQSITVSVPDAAVVVPDAAASFAPPHEAPEPAAAAPPPAADPQFSCGATFDIAMCAQEPAEAP